MENSIEQPVLAGFDATGLSPEILSVLTKNGFTVPTPIQAQAIPVALEGSDIIGIAQTGTGKTLAFGLPMLHHLFARRPLGKRQQMLIIVPTRELAIQVEESLNKVISKMELRPRTVCLIGGMPIYKQIKDLRNNPQIIIGTPGRLRDHLDQKTLDISLVSVLVLDEADRMLDMGFAPQIKYVCSFLPAERQTMLFSATMAPEIESLTHQYLKNPVKIEVARAGTSNEMIRQELCYVDKNGKTGMLEQLLAEHPGTVLVFSRTKHGASKLALKLQNIGLSAAEIHSNRSLGQRRQALEGFKSGRYRVLVATDVAARGIDVTGISLVVNYDLPDAAEDYVHRIGRTGRAGKEGITIAFAEPDQVRDVRAIERLIKMELPLHHASLPQPVEFRSSSSAGNRNRGGGQRSFSSSSYHSGGPRRPQGGGQGDRRGGSSSPAGGNRGFRPKRSSERTPVWGGRFA